MDISLQYSIMRLFVSNTLKVFFFTIFLLRYFSQDIFSKYLLADLDKPIISGKPATTIKEGSSITMFCSASGNPTVSYNWYKNGLFLTTSSYYAVGTLSRFDTGNYSCTALYEFGNKTSDEVQWRIACKCLITLSVSHIKYQMIRKTYAIIKRAARFANVFPHKNEWLTPSFH